MLQIATQPLPPLEKEVEAQGDRLMQTYHFQVVRFSQPRNTMQTPGIPDRRYYHVDRKLTLWWEAKAENGKQSRVQREFQEMCEAVGEVYLVGGIDVLQAYIERHWGKK